MSRGIAGASARRRAAQLRRDEVALQHRRGLPILSAVLLVDTFVVVPAFAETSGFVRLLALLAILGVPAWVARRCYPVGSHVQRWRRGARGEERTARLLRGLARHGWIALHDRAVPRSRANVDHIVISPEGQTFVLDTKFWGSRQDLISVQRGVLRCGDLAHRDAFRTLLWEAGRVQEEIGQPVTPVIVMHGATVPSGHIVHGDIHIIAAPALRRSLRRLTDGPSSCRAHPVARRAEFALPPHTA